MELPHVTLKKQKALEDSLFSAGLIALLAGTAAVIIYFCIIVEKIALPPCIFSTYLGIYCPGCGGTRAFNALLHGRLLQSVWYHPLVLYTAVVFGGFMLTQGLERLGVKHIRGWKYHDWPMYGAVIVLVCNFLMKNLLRWFWGITI